MTGVGPLGLADAVQAVALVLDAGQVRVVGLDGRHTYPHESASAVVTVSVHLDSSQGVDEAAALLGLAEPPARFRSLHCRGGDWRPGFYVSLFGPARQAAGVGS